MKYSCKKACHKNHNDDVIMIDIFKRNKTNTHILKRRNHVITFKFYTSNVHRFVFKSKLK